VSYHLTISTQGLVLTHSRLGEITKSKNAKMFYQNFDDRITANWGIVLRNWPLAKLCSPSDVGSRNELQVLYQAWESNTTHFQKLTETEFKEWEEIRFNAAMNQMVAGDDNNDEVDAIVDPSFVPEATSVPSTAPPLTAAPQPTSALNAGTAEAAPQHDIGNTNENTLSPSAPMAPFVDASLPAVASKRQAPEGSTAETSRKKARPAPFVSFINTVTAVDGSSVQVSKKPRKVRSDKGKKRGSRSKENAGSSSNGAADN
jgi:hypothetical protein